MENLTPMMKQFKEIKRKYQNEIVFFRMGDFYEMFDKDAILASKVLQITLTKRNGIPMCGVPHHAKDNYLYKLIQNGFKVAICDQLELPAKKANKIVKRGVTELITPGTIIDNLDNNNFIASFQYKPYKTKYKVAFSYIDLSTGEFYIYEETEQDYYQAFIDRISNICPSELILPESMKKDKKLISIINKYSKKQILNFLPDQSFETKLGERLLKDLLGIKTIRGLDIENKNLAISSAAALISYIKDAQLRNISHIRKVKAISKADIMHLNESTIRNLELIDNIGDDRNNHTLFKSLDNTNTKIGSRLLCKWILNPSLSIKRIKERQTIVLYFSDNPSLLDQTRNILSRIIDIERILAKISLNKANPKDLLALKISLIQVETLQDIIKEHKIFDKYNSQLHGFKEVIKLIYDAISDDNDINITNGNVIKLGYSKELDALKQISSKSKDFLLKLQDREKEKTKIPKLKIKYNKVVGYFFEVSKSNLTLLPNYYIKKQSLVNANRYTIAELTEYELTILSSFEKVVALEKQLFEEIRMMLCSYIAPVKEACGIIAFLDILSNFAKTALDRNYICPLMHEDDKLIIKNARHPVVELFMDNGDEFIPNDFYLENDNRIIIITGPNMSGKSTYLRELSLIVIMAQIGSFIPASFAKMPIIDKIFTRIGASDNIAKGESTFLVEMSETALILNNASDKSLIIMDEIGRGTSTYDGLSIAWSILEYLEKERLSKVLFATHYHELTELDRYGAINNYQVLVKEFEQGIIFMHKVVKGTANKSYGIQVAKLAGIPKTVIDKAEAILSKLEDNNKKEDATKENAKQPSIERQLDFFPRDYDNLADKVLQLDTKKISPALLYRKIELMQNEIRNGS